MDREKVLIVTRVDLIPWGDAKFYACVIPEGEGKHLHYDVWIFRRCYGIAIHSYGIYKDDLECVSKDHIRDLDESGYFDGIKEELFELS